MLTTIPATFTLSMIELALVHLLRANVVHDVLSKRLEHHKHIWCLAKNIQSPESHCNFLVYTFAIIFILNVYALFRGKISYLSRVNKEIHLKQKCTAFLSIQTHLKQKCTACLSIQIHLKQKCTACLSIQTHLKQKCTACLSIQTHLKQKCPAFLSIQTHVLLSSRFREMTNDTYFIIAYHN